MVAARGRMRALVLVCACMAAATAVNGEGCALQTGTSCPMCVCAGAESAACAKCVWCPATATCREPAAGGAAAACEGAVTWWSPSEDDGRNDPQCAAGPRADTVALLAVFPLVWCLAVGAMALRMQHARRAVTLLPKGERRAWLFKQMRKMMPTGEEVTWEGERDPRAWLERNNGEPTLLAGALIVFALSPMVVPALALASDGVGPFPPSESMMRAIFYPGVIGCLALVYINVRLGKWAHSGVFDLQGYALTTHRAIIVTARYDRAQRGLLCSKACTRRYTMMQDPRVEGDSVVFSFEAEASEEGRHRGHHHVSYRYVDVGFDCIGADCHRVHDILLQARSAAIAEDVAAAREKAAMLKAAESVVVNGAEDARRTRSEQLVTMSSDGSGTIIGMEARPQESDDDFVSTSATVVRLPGATDSDPSVAGRGSASKPGPRPHYGPAAAAASAGAYYQPRYGAAARPAERSGSPTAEMPDVWSPSQVEAVTKVCSDCSAALPGEALYCVKCGKPQTA